MKFYSLDLSRRLDLDDLETLSLVDLGKLYCELCLNNGDFEPFKDKEYAIEAIRPRLQEALDTINDPGPDKRRRKAFNLSFKGSTKSFRKNTKRERMIRHLAKPEGATMGELMAATHWDYRACYSELLLIHHYVGFGIFEESDRRLHLVSA